MLAAVELSDELAAAAAMEACVLLVALLTAVEMVVPVATAGSTRAEVTLRVDTLAAGGAEPAAVLMAVAELTSGPHCSPC